jgi:hypothetical protein
VVGSEDGAGDSDMTSGTFFYEVHPVHFELNFIRAAEPPSNPLLAYHAEIPFIVVANVFTIYFHLRIHHLVYQLLTTLFSGYPTSDLPGRPKSAGQIDR